MLKIRSLILIFSIIILVYPINTKIVESFKVTTLATGLKKPWSMVWINDYQALISEKVGDIKLFNKNTKKLSTLIMPNDDEIYKRSQGGLLDLAVDPNYQKNAWIYLTFSLGDYYKNTTALARFKIKNDKITNFKVVYKAIPYKSGGYHFGSRLAFSDDKTLFMSVGERGLKDSSQDEKGHLGKIIKLNTNDFKPIIYSLGHRNPQGMVYDKLSNQLFANEHGAKGGDEINIIKKGKNYGWPIISYGVNYSGSKIGVGQYKDGLEQPIHYWDPSIAPSGFMVYSGEMFKSYKGNLFLTSLKFGKLIKIELNKKRNKVINEKQFFNGEFGRLRFVTQGKDGEIYLLTDSDYGHLLKLEPK